MSAWASKGKGKGKGAKGKTQAVPAKEPGKDDEGFSLVDSRPMPGKSSGRGRGFGGRGKGKGKAMQSGNYQEGILGQKSKPINNNFNNQKGKSKGKGGNQRRGLPSFKEWSVQTKTEWEMKREIMLSSLAKLQVDAKEVKYSDLLWCGKLHSYNRVFDRINAKTERPMRRFEDLNFFNVSTSDDPHLQEMISEDPDVCMVATDHVLAALIAAARSVYSWDIVVTKISGKLLFDKRQGSQVDFLSVNETAHEPPNNDDKENINSPVKLSQEASCINQNFSQMVLDFSSPAKEMEQRNPFEEEDDDDSVVASGAYRYRKITVPGNPKAENEFDRKPINMIVRTEVNCRMPDARDNKGLVSVKALNEYDPKLNYSWRQHLESQRGACLATELKNNAFKLGRWTAQAILSGCDTMKIGYVSRQSPSDPWSHTVLGVQTHLTDHFAESIGLTRNNMFGILRTIIDLVMQWEDGKYLLLKDPTKSVLRIYELPWDCFKSDDEDGDGDDLEEQDQELDEDGNVAPSQPQGLR
mmetsp:Transcript_40240/g.121609  ORF Transcript_40240/g.121609 Transcript_40240/m.121609 type:complete len:525 (-) Transcript_40240:54-1628(-)